MIQLFVSWLTNICLILCIAVYIVVSQHAVVNNKYVGELASAE